MLSHGHWGTFPRDQYSLRYTVAMNDTARVALILGLLIGSSPKALAHGGPQESVQVLADPRPFMVRSNYGLLRFESEADWRWTCEEVAGSVEITDYAIDRDGNQVLSNFHGLYRSTDGCQWDLIDNELKDGFVTDLEQSDDELWATTGMPGTNNGLWVSNDGGLSFDLDSSFGLGSELKSIKHHGSWMWLSGWTEANPWAAHRSSEDGSWTTMSFDHDDNPIESIHVHQVEENGQAWFVLGRSSNDELWALSPDGSSTLKLETHTPIEAIMMNGSLGLVGTRAGVAWQSTDGGATWTEYTDTPDMGCFEFVDDTIHICSHNWKDGAASMAATQSVKPLDEWDWVPTLWYGDVRAIESCPEGSTVFERCTPLWPIVVPAAGYNLERSEDTDSATAKTANGCAGCASQTGSNDWLWVMALVSLVRRRLHVKAC